MSEDEELLQNVCDLLDPFVRAGWTVDCIVDVLDATGVFFDNGAAVAFKKADYRITERCDDVMPVAVASMRRVQRMDGTTAWRILDEERHTVFAVELAQPTDPLPVYVSALKEALIGSCVQSVTASDGGLCLHLDDDYDAVSNGVSRVRIDANRIPFTVGCVDVNHGDGFDMLRICAADPDDRKPVVMFRLNQDSLGGKELSFNVI